MEAAMKVAPDGGVYTVMPSAWTGAQCAACQGRVDAGELMLGAQQGGGAWYEWQHFACASEEQLQNIRNWRHLNGFKGLTEEDQDTVIAAFEAVQLPAAPKARKQQARQAAAPKRGQRRRKQADSSEGEEEAAGGGGEESHEGCGPRARPQRRRQPTAAERQAAAEEAAASLAAELAERAAAEAAAAAAAAGPAAGVAGEGAAAQMAAQPACSPLQQMLYAALLERFDDELPDRLAPYFAAGQLDDTTLSQLVLSLCSAGVLPPGWPAGTPLLQRAMAMPAVAMAAAEAEAAGQGHVAAAEAAQAEEAEEAEAAGQGSMVPATAPPRVPALRVKVNVPALRQEAEAEELQIDEGEESDYEPPSSPPAPGTTPKHKAGTPRRKSKRVAAKRRQRAQAYGSDDEWVPR